MIFTETPLHGSFFIELEFYEDSRGGFARTFCANEFTKYGLETNFVQANLSTNYSSGIVRGLHYQTEPASEVKVVSCIQGEIYDVIVDVRPHSQTYLKHFAIKLSETNKISLYVPEGFAHGYQTLSDYSAVQYMVSAPYSPMHEGGLRYDDPMIGIKWPIPTLKTSPKDSSWPLLN